MGNACCRKAGDQDEDSDRAHIINQCNPNYPYNDVCDPGDGAEFYINYNGYDPRAMNYVDDPSTAGIPYGSFSCGNKTQEQAALDRIYHRLALNVIDVAPGETMIIQPAEICERQKAYQCRLNQLEGYLSLTLTKTGGVESSIRNVATTTSSTERTAANAAAAAKKLVSCGRGRIPAASVSSSSTQTPAEPSECNTNIDRQKLYQIPDRRRVEYEAIPQDEEELIREYSLRTSKAVKSLATLTINEPVITQFNI